MGVRPPHPGWSLDELLASGRYIDKERHVRGLVFEPSDKHPQYRKSFVSYPRRWSKSVMIQAAAKILRWGGVKASEGRLSEARQPVLMLDFRGRSIDVLSTYICGKIAGFNDSNRKAPMLQLWLEERDAVGAVDALSEALEAKNRKRPLHILVDEYDFPVVDTIDPFDNAKYVKCMKFYRNFFAATKSVKCAIIVTGVSRIGMAGIFNEANHLEDVTFEHEFEGLLGLSWSEIVTYYDNALPLIARWNNLDSIEKLRREIIRWYDGYRWNLSGADSTLFNLFRCTTL